MKIRFILIFITSTFYIQDISAQYCKAQITEIAGQGNSTCLRLKYPNEGSEVDSIWIKGEEELDSLYLICCHKVFQGMQVYKDSFIVREFTHKYIDSFDSIIVLYEPLFIYEFEKKYFDQKKLKRIDFIDFNYITPDLNFFGAPNVRARVTKNADESFRIWIDLVFGEMFVTVDENYNLLQEYIINENGQSFKATYDNRSNLKEVVYSKKDKVLFNYNRNLDNGGFTWSFKNKKTFTR